MPANALLSKGNAANREVLVAAAFLVYAIEHCIPPTTLGQLDDRLEHLASTSDLDDQVCLLLIQHGLDRPLAGINDANASRLAQLEKRLNELLDAHSDYSENKSQVLAQIDARKTKFSPDDDNEPFHFDHLSDDQIQKIEEAAYQGILRFPPARQFPSLTPLVIKTVSDVTRWDARNSDANPDSKQRLAKLCNIARNTGKQRAIDTWRNKAETVMADARTDAIFYDSALCNLTKLSRIERVDYQAILLAELAFGPRERGQDPPYRNWFGMSPGNFRITLMRARQSFSERLEDDEPIEKPITVERTLEALASAALLLAQRAIKAQAHLWTNKSDKPPSDSSPTFHLDLQRPEDSMAPRDLRFDNTSALELLLRRTYSPKNPLPHALVLAASAEMLDERATAFIEKVDYHRLNGLRSAVHPNRRQMLEQFADQRKTPIGAVIVKIMDEFRNWEIRWTGFAIKPAMALGPTTSLSEPPPSIPIRMFFKDDEKEWLEFRINPSHTVPKQVDIAFQNPPENIATIAILSTQGDALSRWLIDANELRDELCSRVIRDVPPGAYQILAVDRNKSVHGWNLTFLE
jgi:hypothetical protein